MRFSLFLELPFELNKGMKYVFIFLGFSGALNAQTNGCLGAGEDKYICINNSIEIGCPENPNYCYMWSPENGLGVDAIHSANPTVSPNETTTYSITITDSNGNLVIEDQTTVFVVKVNLEIFLPSLIAGNDITMINQEDEYTLGSMTVVNLDNDDNDNIYDLDDTSIDGGDDELVRLKIKTDEITAAGMIVKIDILAGSEFIKIWKSKDKVEGEYAFNAAGVGTDFILDENGEAELWIEGIMPHMVQRATILSVCEEKVSLTIIGIESLKWEGNGNGFAPPYHTSNTLDTNDPNFIGVGGRSITNGNETPVLSYRIFSGARAATGFTTPQNEAYLKVKLTVMPIKLPLPNLYFKIYLRAFDIDDPYTDPLPITGNPKFIDPNDDGSSGTYSGTAISYDSENDNRGTVIGGGKYGALDGDTDGDGITFVSFNVDEDIVDEKRISFKVASHPGDNYRIAANADADFLPQLKNNDKDDGIKITDQYILSPNNEILLPQNYLSDVLTVWRILHLEYDSMKDFMYGNNTQQKIARVVDFESPTSSANNFSKLILGQTISGGDASLNLNSTMPRNGRFENGTLYLGLGISTSTIPYNPTPASIVIKPILGNGNFEIRTITPESISGLFFELTKMDGSIITGTIDNVIKDTVTGKYEWVFSSVVVDPSFLGAMLKVGGSDLMPITGVNSLSVITDIFRIHIIVRDDDKLGLLPYKATASSDPDLAALDAYLKAYLVPENDGGGNISNNNTMGFLSNVNSIFHMNSILTHQASMINESSNFWVVHLVSCYQGFYIKDGDANSESVIWGLTDPELVDPMLTPTFNTYVNPRNLANGLRYSMVFREVIRDQPLNSGWTYSRLIAHEVGHQFGLTHGDNDLRHSFLPLPEYPNIGLMSKGASTSSPDLIDRHINLIRSRVNHPGS